MQSSKEQQGEIRKPSTVINVKNQRKTIKWEDQRSLQKKKKNSDTKGTSHAKMDTIKDRNGMDVTEAEDIKNRWQEYTQKVYKKRSS